MLHITKIKPMFTHLLVTGDTFEKDMYDGGVIVAKAGDLKAWQTVLAIGSTVRDIKVGDKVMIKIENFVVKKYSKDSLQNDLDNNRIITYNIPFETIEDKDGKSKECIYINDQDVKYVFEGEEKEDILITPDKPKLII